MTALFIFVVATISLFFIKDHSHVNGQDGSFTFDDEKFLPHSTPDVIQYSSNQILVEIAGIHIGNRYSYAEECCVLDELTLVHEPHNTHDKKAIAIYNEEHKLGYIPANYAKEIAVEMDNGVQFAAWFNGCSDDDGYLNAEVIVERVNEV